MSSTYGENLKLSIFGQSHGAGIGMTLDGIPAGLPVDTAKLQAFNFCFFKSSAELFMHLSIQLSW